MEIAQAAPKRGGYYGWKMLPFILIFSYLQYSLWLVSIGASIGPVTTELGWTRTFAMGAYSLGAAVGSFSGPVLGTAIDRFSPRKLMMIGGTVGGLGAWLVSFADVSWLFWYAGWILMMAFGYTWLGYACTGKVLTNWFLKRRGFAMGLLAASGSFVYMMSTVHAIMVEGLGWRMTWRVWGVIIWVGLVGIALLVIRDRPEDKGYKIDGEPMTTDELVAWRSRGKPLSQGPGAQAKRPRRVEPEIQLTVRQALMYPALYLLCLEGLTEGGVLQIMTTQQLPMLQARGIPTILAASVLGFQGLSGAPGRFLGGWLFDVFGKNSIRFVYSLAAALTAIGLLFLVYATDLTGVFLFATTFGFGEGLAVIAPLAMLPNYFGRGIYGTLYGFRMFILGFGSVFAPLGAAWAFDTTGSYDIALWVGVVWVAIAGVGILFALPPKPKGAV